MVFAIEEISVVSGPMYNMLDFRSMYGRSKTHQVHEQNYHRQGNAFGRIPIVIHLGDFFKLKPTANISLVDDFDAENKDGEWIHQDVSVEVQHACRLLSKVPRWCSKLARFAWSPFNSFGHLALSLPFSPLASGPLCDR